MAKRRVGVWLIGAKGGVATTTIVGLVALKKGLAPDCGLVSQLPEFSHLELLGFKDLSIGGHEIRQTTLFDEAMKLHTVSRVLDQELLSRCKTELDRIDKQIVPGTILNVGSTIEKFASSSLRHRVETPRQAIERIQSDYRSFLKSQQLDQLIVINLASTEPPLDDSSLPARWKELERLLDRPAKKSPLAASSIYAIAALDLGLPYVNFTPSVGSAPPAICELALERETCHMGHDGKTGETLLKSVLAPMFAHRNLEVMSWVGHNIFGNMDGKVLDDPENKKTKVRSKDRLLHQILGYHPQTHVSIEYIESLGDWKTAWDHIHFRGFLNTPMVLQFTWQGCDSLLAAPLVIDLLRFTELAARRKEHGLLTFLCCFFKSPLGTPLHDFSQQFQVLKEWSRK
ncbi:MAG: myo-inositol-1-phosphate synthase [Planctomycetes bacterium]|nr:myo-inositol-1-phosphate synthase [Planctomycetota bacterium]